MKEKIVEIFGIDPKNIEVIPGGVDTSLFRPFRVAQETVLSKYGIEKRGKIVLFVGKLTKVKGVEYLLKAAKIYEKSNGIITLISGYGEQFDELTHLSNKLGLKNIYFLGHQRQEDLVYLYNIAEVTIIPSIFEYFGLVAIESLATGTPVIGTRVGGLPYILKNNTGYIVEPKDYKDLADKILKIMDVEFKKSRSNQISNYAKKNFSWDVIVKKTEKVYNEALGV
jgi:glycosyltransferase involved in cell wall biosynthesis